MGAEGRLRRTMRRAAGAGTVGLLAGTVCHPAAGSPATAGAATRLSISSGVDITGNSRSGYAGGVWAPDRGLDMPGFRIKALGGYGVYAYDGALPLSGGLVPVRFQGDYFLGDLMGGRMWRRGEWTVKGYAGLQFVSHDISPNDPSNNVSGSRWGAIAQLELWRNFGRRAWLSADGSYATTFGDYWAQVKLGRRLSAHWSAGIEGGGLGNEDYDAARGGAFVRLHLGSSELTISGGVTGDYRGEGASGYLTVGLYRRR